MVLLAHALCALVTVKRLPWYDVGILTYPQRPPKLETTKCHLNIRAHSKKAFKAKYTDF